MKKNSYSFFLKKFQNKKKKKKKKRQIVVWPKKYGLAPFLKKGILKRLHKPLLPKGFQPQPPPRPRHGRPRQEILRRFDPIQPQRVREPTNYQNEIVDLYEVAKHEVEQKGRHFIRWRFIRDLEKDLTPRFMENIEQNVRTSFYLRHVYSIQP